MLQPEEPMGDNNGKARRDSEPKKKPSLLPQPETIGEEVTEYLKHIDALATNLPLLMLLTFGHCRVTASTYVSYLQTNGQPHPDEEGAFLVKVEYLGEIQRLERAADHARIGDIMLPRSFLVAMVSQYDFFLSRLIRRLFLLRPEKVNSLEKPLTFAQLQKFGSIDDAKEYVLEKEIETVLRQSHAEQFDWLEKKFDVTTLTKGLDIWPAFIEITERRNLFVHCYGIVSSQYRAVCGNHKVKDIASLGSRLNVDPEYFERAHLVLSEIAVKLAHVLWRKAAPDQRDDADDSYNGVLYDLILQERYGLAIKLGHFWIDTLQRKESTDRVHRMITLNLAQAYKWSGKPDEAKRTTAVADWSATGDIYQLALAVLDDDFNRAADLMKKMGEHSDVGEDGYQHWPIFKEFRKTEPFRQMYEVVFGHPFVTVQKAPLARSESSRQANQAIAALIPEADYVI